MPASPPPHAQGTMPAIPAPLRCRVLVFVEAFLVHGARSVTQQCVRHCPFEQNERVCRGPRPSPPSSSASHELGRPITDREVSFRQDAASAWAASEGGSPNLSLADSVGPRGGSLLPADSVDSLRSSLGPAWQDMSWQIDPSEVEILKDAQGRDWLLGQGGYGSVRALSPPY